MSNKNLVAIFVVLVLVLGGVVFFLKYEKPAGSKDQADGGNSALSQDLPVPLTNSAVTAVFFSYNFYGEIKELKTVDGNIELTLTDPELPVFILTDKTKVQTTSKNQVTGALDREDLKVRLGVTVVAYYDTKAKTWTTPEVYVPTDVQSLN